MLRSWRGQRLQGAPSPPPGLESWLRAEYSDSALANRPFSLGPTVYIGPTAMVNFGKLWWSVGEYFRVTDYGRVLQPGDTFGGLWIRTVIGLSF